MFENSSIITVGISPAWDIVCSGDDIEWFRHSVVSQRRFVAGKAFNVSKALGWMGRKNYAAGLWGEVDFSEMQVEADSISELVDVRFTKAVGRTRENITVIDIAGGREMHLRAESELVSGVSLAELEKDLKEMAGAESVFVFAGSMPGGEELDGVISLIRKVKESGAKIVADTSGKGLKKIVSAGEVDILKPNTDELSELVGVSVQDVTDKIVRAAKPLLDKAKVIVVTRGEKGAVVITKDAVLEGRCVTENKVVRTVGCGDYFLAGFLCGQSLEDSLAKGLKAGAVRAWSDNRTWAEIENETEVQVFRV